MVYLVCIYVMCILCAFWWTLVTFCVNKNTQLYWPGVKCGYSLVSLCWLVNPYLLNSSFVPCACVVQIQSMLQSLYLQHLVGTLQSFRPTFRLILYTPSLLFSNHLFQCSHESVSILACFWCPVPIHNHLAWVNNSSCVP